MQQETIADVRPAPAADDYRAQWPPPAPVRVCPQCSAQAQTDGAFCPHCGASYMRKRRRTRLTRRGRIARFVALAIVLAGGGAAGLIFKLDHDKRAHAAAVAAQQKRDEAKRQAAADDLERSNRADLVKSLEKSVTKDAEKRVNDGLLTGPVLRTQCEPASGSNPDDLSVTTADYTCLAVTSEKADGTSEGYRFSATANFDQLNYTWHLGG